MIYCSPKEHFLYYLVQDLVDSNVNTSRAEIIRPSFAHRVRQAHPVYITLPSDRVDNKIPRTRLDTPLQSDPQTNDPHTDEFVLGEIQKLVEAACSEMVILVDACTFRHDVTGEIWDLIKHTGFPVYSAPMGMAAVPVP